MQKVFYGRNLLTLTLILSIVLTVSISAPNMVFASTLKGNSSPGLTGGWQVEYIEDIPVISGSPASFLFLADNRVAGNTSCNRFTGEFESSNGRLTFGKLAVTGMACLGPLSEQENRFAKALRRVTSWKIESGSLLLFDDNGMQLFSAAPVVIE